MKPSYTEADLTAAQTILGVVGGSPTNTEVKIAEGLAASRAAAEELNTRLQELLSWTQACVVRSAHALAMAADGRGIDGASLHETVVGVSSGLMEVDAAITRGEPPAAPETTNG